MTETVREGPGWGTDGCAVSIPVATVTGTRRPDAKERIVVRGHGSADGAAAFSGRGGCHAPAVLEMGRFMGSLDRQISFPAPRTRMVASDCGREPIDASSGVQAHGMLLAATGPELRIAYVGGKVEKFLGMAPREILGRPLGAILGVRSATALANFQSQESGVPSGRLTITLPGNSKYPFQAFTHRFNGLLYVELEPYLPGRQWNQLTKGMDAIIAGLRRAETQSALCATAAAQVRDLTGYDHVMIYRFDGPDHGEVVAEQMEPGAPGHPQMHFPSFSSSSRAMAIYPLQRIRVVADLAEPALAIFSDPELSGGRPLDLTYCRLSGVAAPHSRYMKRMGARASFAVALVHEQQLWGVILCHHRTPRQMPPEVQAMCDLLGQIVSMLIAATERNEQHAAELASRRSLDTLGALLPPGSLFAAVLAENTDDLLGPVGAAGALIQLQGHTRLVGATPPLDLARATMAAMRGELDDGLAVRAAGQDGFETRGAAMLIAVGDSPEDGVLWFRPEAPPGAALEGANAFGTRAGESTVSWKDADISMAHDFQRMLTVAMLRHGDVQAHLGYLDALTNLPNRRVLLDRLARCGREQPDSPACLIFIDVDRFKMVNDTLGHAAGDELLIQLGRRLIECAGARHLVARLGGDEFVVFCEQTAIDAARKVAATIVAGFEKPFLLNGKPFRCATSIGLAPAGGGGRSSITDILHAADSAMYAAKQLGGNQFVVFENPLHEELMRQIQLEQDLFHAMERGEMRVHFQAQISVVGHRLIGFEALLRWEHPTYGNVPPVEFIPMAEYTGHIQALGAWVLRESLRQIGSWRDRYHCDLFVAVNVSVKQIAAIDFAEKVRQALAETGVPSEALHLEVTESMLMQPSAEPQLRAIQALGVKIAIDDFGTGYSSLSYLPRLAVSEVKLDRTFLEDVGRDERKTALFGAIVRMAHALDLIVVAEGIENAAQLECIRECFCDGAQGYLLSKPISADKVEALLLTEWKDGLLGHAPG